MSAALDERLLWEYGDSRREDRRESLPVDTCSEADLVSRACSGEVEAFEELVRLYRNDVYGLAWHFLRNREDAWDASQEVFVKAHKALRRFRGDASFKTWLLRITANHCKDALKRRRLRTVPLEDLPYEPPVDAPGTDPGRAAEAGELAAALDKSLNMLSHKHKTAFILREMEGMSYEEMAGVMGCSMGTVMSRLHHARRNLRDLLAEWGALG